jgi:hypothetical protein
MSTQGSIVLFCPLFMSKKSIISITFIDLRSKCQKKELQNMRIVQKTLHTAHKGGSREVSHVQKFTKQADCLRRKNGAAASLSGSGLK